MRYSVDSDPVVCNSQLFSFLGVFSAARHYLCPRVLMLECDRKNHFEKKLTKDRKTWKKNQRLYQIVAVGGDAARRFWTWTYVLCVLFFVLVAVGKSIEI